MLVGDMLVIVQYVNYSKEKIMFFITDEI